MSEEDKEFTIGRSRVYLGDDDIIHGIFEGDVNAETATKIGESILKLSKHVEGKVNILNDINKTGNPSTEARKILQKYIIHEKIGKVAIFGMHPVARIIASFFIGVTKKKDIQFFKTKEEAVKWLKE